MDFVAPVVMANLTGLSYLLVPYFVTEGVQVSMLSTYMKQRIVAKGVKPERTHTVHVWSAKDEIVPTPRDENPLIDELGLRDKFVVMYSGNAGIVHDFDDRVVLRQALERA